MEIFDRLKSIVGIGKATIELIEVPETLRPGAELHATVVLRGGEYDVAVADVHVHFDEERLVFNAPGNGEFERHQECASVRFTPSAGTLARGEEVTFPVTFALPAALEASSPHRRYTLTAETEIPGINPRHVVVVEIEA